MRALLLVVALAACGDNKPARDDAGTGDGSMPDATQPLRHCLDHPTNLVKPPTGQLPCDLLPPGFGQ
ncbi:MAG TPA: hypothetical protein VIV11_04080 [Kofleriaceae bacterium]